MFTIHCLEVAAEAVTPLSFDRYCGSALRGAFFRAIWKRFCTNRESPTCRECPLVMACPVAALVAPLRDEPTTGHDVPRPYIISPPSRNPNRYEQGESLLFHLSLVGTSTKLFPYVIHALQEMGNTNLGHPLPELQGRRGSLRIREIRAYHPLTHIRQVVWKQGSTQAQKLQLSVTPDDVKHRAERLPADHMTLHFLSPTRLIFEERLVKHPGFRVLALRLAERLRALYQAYSGDENSSEARELLRSNREWYQQIDSWAQEVQLVSDETRWVDIQSYSARQKKTTPIGGFIGKASYTGDLTHLRELLVWGELLHIGKNVVKGNGIYQICE